MYINVHNTFYIRRPIQCVPKDGHITYRHFEIAVKSAVFQTTILSEAMLVANNDY